MADFFLSVEPSAYLI